MTHDELMVKINQRYWKMFNHNSQDQTESGIEHRTFIQNQYFALRAVVKFHKPVLKSKNKYICEGCNLFYPCETIQAVEKELA